MPRYYHSLHQLIRMLLCGLLPAVSLLLAAACQTQDQPASSDALTAPLTTQTAAPAPSADPRVTDLDRVKEGKPAPDFALEDINDRIVHLSDYRGQKNVILIFYRGHF